MIVNNQKKKKIIWPIALIHKTVVILLEYLESGQIGLDISSLIYNLYFHDDSGEVAVFSLNSL